MKSIDCRGTYGRKETGSTLFLALSMLHRCYLFIHVHFPLKYSFLKNKNHVLFLCVQHPEKHLTSKRYTIDALLHASLCLSEDLS